MPHTMNVVRLQPHAILPNKAFSGDLGYDLFASETKHIMPNSVEVIKTDIACRFPSGYGALIRDRSSVATKKQLFVVAGVIDNGYTGEILIALYNSSTHHSQTIFDGDKIAQMILIAVTYCPIQEVDSITSQDGRAIRGFGSTGF